MSSRELRRENEMIKRRERDLQKEEFWKSRQKYYDQWEKKNAKFDEWTSPRYHESQTKLVAEMKSKQEKEDCLKLRRENLRKLLQEEEKSNQIALMMTNLSKMGDGGERRRRNDEIPVEILRDLNKNLRLEEDERSRRDAELKLYHQWRECNPILRHCERMQRGRDMKLTWLDQQIENRMKKEKEEEECRKILKERDRQMKELEEREKFEKDELERKKSLLRECLDEQVKELRLKSEAFEKLKLEENEIAKHKMDLDDLKCQKDEELKRRLTKECALYNLKQYKLKLKYKAREIVDNLENERKLVEHLKALELSERIADAAKKAEIKDSICQFLSLNREQKSLERKRQLHLDFIFDSECQQVFEKQDEIWKREEEGRLRLLSEVLTEIQCQIDAKLQKSVELQREALKERESIMERIDEYNRELELLKVAQMERKIDRRREIDEDVAVKKAHKTLEKTQNLRKINEELERIKKEEERLQNEIIQIQRRQGPYRPVNNRIIY